MKRTILPTIGILIAAYAGSALGAKSSVESLDDKAIAAFTAQATPAIVEFYAPNDPDVRAYRDAFEKFCGAHTNVRCGALNVDEYFLAAKQYNNIPATPFYGCFKDGKLSPPIVKGAQGEEQLGKLAEALTTAPSN